SAATATNASRAAVAGHLRAGPEDDLNSNGRTAKTYPATKNVHHLPVRARSTGGAARWPAPLAQAGPGQAQPQPPGRAPAVEAVLDHREEFLAVPFPPRAGVPAE